MEGMGRACRKPHLTRSSFRVEDLLSNNRLYSWHPSADISWYTGLISREPGMMMSQYSRDIDGFSHGSNVLPVTQFRVQEVQLSSLLYF